MLCSQQHRCCSLGLQTKMFNICLVTSWPRHSVSIYLGTVPGKNYQIPRHVRGWLCLVASVYCLQAKVQILLYYTNLAHYPVKIFNLWLCRALVVKLLVCMYWHCNQLFPGRAQTYTRCHNDRWWCLRRSESYLCFILWVCFISRYRFQNECLECHCKKKVYAHSGNS